MSKYTKSVNRIRALRLEKGWSAEDLRQQVQDAVPDQKISSSTILKLEKGAVALSDKWSRLLASVLGCQPWELSLREDPGVPVLSPGELVSGRKSASDDHREYVAWPGSPSGKVAFRARSDDAEHGLRQGDAVIVRTGRQDGWPLCLCIEESDDGTMRLVLREEPDPSDLVVGDVVQIQHDIGRKGRDANGSEDASMAR